jgi:hypothetical protein
MRIANPFQDIPARILSGDNAADKSEGFERR